MNFFRELFSKFYTAIALECPICLININRIQAYIIVTKCGHLFCFLCFLKTKYHECPICRQYYSYFTFINKFYCYVCFRLNNIVRYFCPTCGQIICSICLNNKQTLNNIENTIICSNCNCFKLFRRMY